MATTRPTNIDSRVEDRIDSEWDAAPLRPVAHWVSMPVPGGGSRLQMMWETPDPMPSSARD